MSSCRRRAGAAIDGVGAAVSTIVTFTVGTAVHPVLGAGLVLLGLLVIAPLATGRAETFAVRAMTGARKLRDYELAALRPVIAVLEEFDLTSPAVNMLLREGRQATRVSAAGRHTLVVPEGLISAIANRRVHPDEAAAVLAHAIGRIRLGQTRYDIALGIWLLPWRALQSFGAGAGQAIRCRPLIAFAWRLRFVTGAVALVQGVAGGRAAFGVLGAVAVAMSYLVPWLARRVALAEEEEADWFVNDTGLGDALSRYLESGQRTARVLQRTRFLRTTHEPAHHLLPPGFPISP